MNGGGEDGDPGAPGPVPLLPPGTLLTMTEGQGVVSVAGSLERVMLLSGTAVGQSVPHGAKTVEMVVDCNEYEQTVERMQHSVDSPERLRPQLQWLPRQGRTSF